MDFCFCSCIDCFIHSLILFVNNLGHGPQSDLPKVLTVKSGVGQNEALHAPPTVGNSFFLLCASLVHSPSAPLSHPIFFSNQVMCDVNKRSDFDLWLDDSVVTFVVIIFAVGWASNIQQLANTQPELGLSSVAHLFHLLHVRIWS